VALRLPDPDVAQAILDECFASDRNGIVAVLKAYFDESGTDRGSPWITLAGWVTERDRWGHLTIGWRRVLKGPPEVPESKAADIEARRGAFGGWTDRQVEDFRWKLSTRIHAQVRFLVAPVRN
jgi:hypothetical protein